MDRAKNKEQSSDNSAQEEFITRLRSCAERLSVQNKREEILREVASLFAEFSGAASTVLIDFSRESLELYRSNPESGDALAGSAVILEESIGPLLELLRDRYMSELGIKVFNKRILNAPEGVEENSIERALDELGMEQGFVLPLMVARNFGAENISGILLINKVPSHRFADPSHLALLRMAADLIALTSDNRDLGNALARLRPTDQFTGLASRNKLNSLLSQEIARSEYLSRSFALVYADVDNLKSLNARQGYRYGDLVVKTVAEDILKETRPIDTACRWSGESYLVLLPECGKEEAMEFAERCRTRVAKHAISPDDYHEEIFVTLSFGVVLYPEHGAASEVLLRKVDLALLQSKLNGRDQSTLWSPEWSLFEAKADETENQ